MKKSIYFLPYCVFCSTMQFIATNAKFKTEKRLVKSTKEALSFYEVAPTEELTLDEFEMLSLERLQLLRAVEQLKAKYSGEDKLFNYELLKVRRPSLYPDTLKWFVHQVSPWFVCYVLPIVHQVSPNDPRSII